MTYNGFPGRSRDGSGGKLDADAVERWQTIEGDRGIGCRVAPVLRIQTLSPTFRSRGSG